MEVYPIFLEVFLYVAAFYLFYRKQELIIIYLPMLFFTRTLIEEFLVRQIIWYFLVTMFIVFAAYRVNFLKKINLAAVVLFVYFTILYIFSPSLSETRSTFFSMVCLMAFFIILPNLYEKHGREAVLTNLYRMSLCVLVLFVGNTILCTATGYSPYQIYGRSTGVLYGSMGPTEFMLPPIALFVFLMHNVKRVGILRILFAFVAFAFILLTFRRTVQFAAVLAVGAFLFLLMVEGGKLKAALTGGVIVTVAVLAFLFTDLDEQFTERYESRFGDQEFVATDEGRFTDHVMVFEDIFIYGRYSMLFGHSFFNSAGNYGGVSRGERSLHPDVAVLVHASGLVGLVLYGAMITRGFRQSLRSAQEFRQKVTWLFCLGVFLTFTFSGRITEASYSLGIAALLFSPLAESRRSPVEAVEEASEGQWALEESRQV